MVGTSAPPGQRLCADLDLRVLEIAAGHREVEEDERLRSGAEAAERLG
jgi:hypothetical protein